MSWAMASDVLLFGLAVFVIGGILVLKVTIGEDGRAAPPLHHPTHMTFRRSLPRHGICRLGVALMIVGVIGMLASYLVRF